MQKEGNSPPCRIERLVSTLSDNYNLVKYRENPFVYFALNYDKNTNSLLIGKMGSYSDLVDQAVDAAKENDGWRQVIGHVPSGTLPTIKKRLLVPLISANWPLVRAEIFKYGDGISQGVKEDLEDIIFDKKLAREVANEYIDFHKEHKDESLKSFLLHYQTGVPLNKRSRADGQYKALYRRVYREAGAGWQEHFYGILPDNLKERVKLIAGELGSKTITESDKVDFIEKLVELKSLGLLEALGADAYDLLVAIYGSHQFQEKDREAMSAILDNPRTLSKYLGVCRKPRRSDDLLFDWAQNLLGKISGELSIDEYNRNQVVRAILKNRVIANYDIFGPDIKGMIAKIKVDLENSTSDIEKILLEHALKHYKLMLRCSTLKGVKKTIRISKRNT